MLYSVIWFDVTKHYKKSIFNQTDIDGSSVEGVIKTFKNHCSNTILFCVPNPKNINFVDEKKAVIYFVRLQNFIKIGYTTNLIDRINTLQCAIPFDLELLYIIPLRFASVSEYRHKENAIHDYIKDYRFKREWFYDDCLNDRYIKRLLQEYGGYNE